MQYTPIIYCILLDLAIAPCRILSVLSALAQQVLHLGALLLTARCITFQSRAGYLLYDIIIALHGCCSLVDKLITAALVHPCTQQGKQMRHQPKAHVHLHAVLRGHPLEGLLRGIGQAAEEGHADVVGQLGIVNLLHPDVGNLGIEALYRLQVGSEYLALTDILLPQGLRQLVVGFILGCYLLDTRQLYTEDEAVLQTLLSQALRDDAVHEETELGLYFADGGLHNEGKGKREEGRGKS